MSTIAPSPTTLPVGVWNADPVHSSVGFSARHMVVSTFRGGFGDFAARLAVDPDGTSRIDGTVRSASIDTRDDTLTGHLLSPDFLDAEAHPEIGFSVARITRDGDRIEAAGQITVKGITREVSATGVVTGPTEDPWGSTRLGLELQTTIDRRGFDMTWNTPLPTGGLAVGYEVELSLHLELIREQA